MSAAGTTQNYFGGSSSGSSSGGSSSAIVDKTTGQAMVVTKDDFVSACKYTKGDLGSGPCCLLPLAAGQTKRIAVGLQNGQMVQIASCSSGNMMLIAGAAIAAILLMKVL
jgi:hypothetical protein